MVINDQKNNPYCLAIVIYDVIVLKNFIRKILCFHYSYIQKRWGSFRNSSQYEDPTKYTDYKITKDPQEWEYVQRLLKPKTIPVPCLENKDYPSGWKPPVGKLFYNMYRYIDHNFHVLL